MEWVKRGSVDLRNPLIGNSGYLIVKAVQLSKQKNQGFTLVEIMIVVLIIGILTAMAYPAFLKVKIHSQASRVAGDFRTFSGLFETYTLDNGTYPTDAGAGTMPSGMAEYIKSDNWVTQTPIGGNYEWDFNGFSGTPVAAIAVTNFTAGIDPVQKLDEIMDDGNLGSGIIQSSGGRVVYIIE